MSLENVSGALVFDQIKDSNRLTLFGTLYAPYVHFPLELSYPDVAYKLVS